MTKGMVTIEVQAPPEPVFDLVHDYSRRLEWDSMLSEARLMGGATAAGVGVRSLCVGTWRSAFLPMETEYVSFRRGHVAAVRLTNRPPFFERFAATIRHKQIDAQRSQVTYLYNFKTRPTALAWLLTPIISWLMAREVRSRLESLRHHFAGLPSATGRR